MNATTISRLCSFHRSSRFQQLTLLALSALFAGCAVFFPNSRPSDPVEGLRYDISRVLSDSIFIPARPSIKVISLDRKEVLFERDSKILTRPASNMKLVTSASALGVLGKNYVFKTPVLAESTATDGVLGGNLYLKGLGNPDLVTSDLDSLAGLVKLAGIRSVAGGVCVDVSFFDDEYWGYGWNWDDEPYSYAAFITPLAVNDNCVVVTVTPGVSSGDSVQVVVDPATPYITVLNKARTVQDSIVHPLVVTRLFKERLNTVLVDGEMRVNAKPTERTISVWKPELYAATLFTEALQRKGIQVGKAPSAGTAPTTSTEIAALSHGIDSTIVNMNKVSDNLSAEMLLKTLGTTSGGTPGSAQGGAYVAHRFLSSLGIDTATFNIADGSGLSYHDLLTAEMLCQLLEGMSLQKELFPLFRASLPIAGVDGTLRNRMKKTPAEGNLRAKTGTISGVSSLSGYVQTLDGEVLAFSMTMQNFIFPTRLYQRAQDRIGALLAGFSRIGRTASLPSN
ncbi:MAG: D-alanyl-D-alanine carboxypeptidase/D-alanyl-D-alanine-endopeptidase [Ignavibacteriales bacterium]|nr:D-alanyl-D-alanine carboxypeptidase/D-alanyl-D-alanine-endopeptidase [Ignavibacteriales bacterium]